MTVKFNVGSKIQQIRESKQISQHDVAHGSHLSLEQFAAIESNQTAPGLGILIRIARAMGVRLGTFLDDQQTLGPTLVRANEYQQTINCINNKELKANLNFFSLAPDKNDRHMEPFVVTIDPLDAQNSGFSSHEGEEFLYVLEGEIEVKYGKDSYMLSAGDSIYLDSIVEHQVKSNNNAQAKVLAVIYVPL